MYSKSNFYRTCPRDNHFFRPIYFLFIFFLRAGEDNIIDVYSVYTMRVSARPLARVYLPYGARPTLIELRVSHDSLVQRYILLHTSHMHIQNDPSSVRTPALLNNRAFVV